MSFEAGEADSGSRLDAALAEHGLTASRAAAARLIDDGRVTVDGRARPKAYRLAVGERVELSEPAQAQELEQDIEVPFEIAFEDGYLMIVDKPAGVVVHPGAGRSHGTLAQALRGRAAGGDDPQRAGIVHRLDRDTSGLMIVAKSDEAHARLQRLIAEREVRRSYLALVEGRPDARTGTIDAAIGRDRNRRTLVSTDTDRPRHAVTHFEVREELPSTTLLDVRLETGRTHQIRAHMAAIGHPVCGDGRYGGGASGVALGLDRQFLHSASLMFRHPFTGADLTCESEQPADLCRALDAARRDPAPGGPDGS